MRRPWRAGVLSRLGAAWPGAAVGAVLAALAFAVDVALRLRVGLGTAAELVASVGLGLVAIALAGLAVIALRAVLARGPALLAAGLLGPFALVATIFYLLDAGMGVALLVAGALVLLGAALGGALALVIRAPRGRRAAAWSSLVVVLAAWVAVAAWLRGPGAAERREPVAGGAVPALAAADPSRPGPYVVRFLTYGSGRDRRRPEYAGGVALRTEPVDAARLLTNLRGLKAGVRRWYWGFGPEALPLNGRVWYPAGDGPFPLVLVVHGNHQMEDYADGGYAYLGQLLASRGFIAVSVDENFLNRSWSGDVGHEQGVRGWLLLQHLAAWRRWNATPGHPFHSRVDLGRIALIGHSRGGEAVAHAAAFNRLPCLPDDCTVPFDFRFSIQALVALAPTDGGYRPAGRPVPIEDVSYLVLHGTHDGDVADFQGLSAFRRARFTDGAYRFKAAVDVAGANHDDFSTALGGSDLRPPFRGFARRAGLLGGAAQRRLTAVFVSGFLEAALNGRREYVPMFRDVRAVAGWLPATAYWSQFEESTFQVVSDFGTGIDPARGTLPGSVQAGENLSVWRPGSFKGRGDWDSQVPVVYLGWDRGRGGVGRYGIALPDGAAARLGLHGESRLAFTVAAAREDGEPLDFTIEVATADGAAARLPLSRIAPLRPVPRVRLTKWPYLERQFYSGHAEPVFQTYEIPLDLLAAPGLRPERIREVRFVFDRTPSGTIVLSSVGFAP